MAIFKKHRYMDFASATPVLPSVVREMERGIRAFGNPSAPHQEGREAKALLEEARARLAKTLRVKTESLTFTSGGTESNNLAVSGVLEALIASGARPESLHVITSAFEHTSLDGPFAYWERRGVAVSRALPDEEGIVTPEEIKKHIRKETALISIAAVQSEIGQVQRIRDIAHMLEPIRAARAQSMQAYAPASHFPLLHTDASQGSLFVDLSPDRLGADLVSYDAQKIMGPKGVGLVYKRSHVLLAPLIRGGKQERSIRPGTENVAQALGIARAFEYAYEGRPARAARVTAVRDYFIALLAKEVPHAVVNGGLKHRIANNVHISIPGTDGDYLAVVMDKEGISVSPRSSCVASGALSAAVVALGKGEDEALGTLRFTFGPDVTKSDARAAVSALSRALAVIDRTK